MKNKFYYIFVVFILIFSISFIIFKIKDKKIDNWNITKNVNNDIIENFNDLVDDMCNNAKILFDKNKNLSDNPPEIKKTIINAVCNDVKSVRGNNKRKEIYQILKKKQEELDKLLENNN